MDVFTIELSEQDAERLRELAREARLSPEQILTEGVDAWLANPERRFEEAAAYVIEKDRELHRRLT